ncbi:hypothetical protein ACJMK2_040057 [Sinanodonta woodiana]|uniref:Carnitine O-acetyltransferase n=1 Tax=Sinanodonta woodiana TaxID=1069815 RepID=A0ABD3WDV4_SINWO
MIRILSRRLVSASQVLIPNMPLQYPPQVKGRMFSVQQDLPRFPVPPLDQTLQKYLISVKPLLSEAEFRQTEKVVQEFRKDLGPMLNELLKKKAETEANWLSEWWKYTAYLDYRMPVVIHSNPGTLFPRQSYRKKEEQIQFAAKVLAGVLDYKMMIDEQSLPVEKLGNSPLCMMQYYQIMSACRIPGLKRDSWDCISPDHPNAPIHITVIHNNHFFSVDVYGKDRQPLNIEQLTQQLVDVVEMSPAKGPPIGVFTMENRNNWAKTYNKLIKDKVNKASLTDIQNSIIVLCLDDPLPEQQDEDSLRVLAAHEMLHGGGIKHNSGNRWFDKTIQFIVGANGYCGLNYEHTTAEGPPIISIVDHVLKFCKLEQHKLPAVGLKKPRKLQFHLSNQVQEDLSNAISNADSMVNDLDMTLLTFKDYGKDFPKSQKLSPDSFIQIAIQLAYYRIHKEPCASYETASLRKFQLGRTDTIRSCSIESFNFTNAMDDASLSSKQKADLLLKAVNGHKNYTNQAVNGEGIDRHLLGLKLIARENGMNVPALHMDTAYSTSTHWKISTSQVPAQSESVLVFGPVVPDGYGICYNPQEQQILFGVSSFNNCKDTFSEQMAANLRKALLDMRNVLAGSLKASL